MEGLGAVAALAMGLFGGVHCATMCGGIASVFCTGPSCSSVGQRASVAAASNAGRIGAYAILGVGVGALGGTLDAVLPVEAFQTGARVLVAMTLLVVGLYLAGAARWWSRVEGISGPLFRRVTHLLAKPIAPTLPAAASRGLLWGFIPCGLVYGALALALASGSARGGAIIMLAFGVGTLPAIGLAIVLSSAVRHWLRHQRIRTTAGLLVGLLGAAQLALVFIQVGALPVPEAQRPCCAHRAAELK